MNVDRYTDDLHIFIRNSIQEMVEFSIDDLLERWPPDRNTSSAGNANAVSPKPPKKKRIEKAAPVPKPVSRLQKVAKSKTKSKDTGANQKKSMEHSSHQAAMEIIDITHLSTIFPPQQAITDKPHTPPHRPEKEQAKQLWSPPAPPPLKLAETPHTAHQTPPPTTRPFQQNLNHRQLFTTEKPIERDFDWAPSPIRTKKTAYSERTALASTGNIYRSALSTLDEYSDEQEYLQRPSFARDDFNDSGIYSDIDVVSAEDKERDKLRERIEKLDKENADLKRQLDANRGFEGTYSLNSHDFDFPRDLNCCVTIGIVHITHTWACVIDW